MSKKQAHPLIEKMAETQRQFQAEAKKVLGEEFKAFFEKVPEVATVEWRQYTPYFNDGDTCEFGVHDAAFKPNRTALATLPEDVAGKLKATPDEDMSDGGYDDVQGIIKEHTTLHWKPTGKREATKRERELISACESLNGLVNGLGDVMKGIFGDHVRVTATAAGFDVDEYDHD